jgi:hypothetical protein
MTVTPLNRTGAVAARPTCAHTPTCPAPTAPDHDAARVVSAHPEQGWSLLCNGVVLFDDTGELLPSGACVAPHRPGTLPHAA